VHVAASLREVAVEKFGRRRSWGDGEGKDEQVVCAGVRMEWRHVQNWCVEEVVLPVAVQGLS
jgi:hypothetical protein